MFKWIEFPVAGMTILKEGELVNKAYIIKEGECKMVSKWIPVDLSVVISSDY